MTGLRKWGWLAGKFAVLRAVNILILAAILMAAQLSGPVHAQQAMRIENVTIKTSKGVYSFQTEIADTPPLRERGLMFRREMAPDRAMLFDWGEPLVASMWMVNTYISLDMVFISGDGTVRYVAEGTTPLSRDIVSAGIKVRAVLELIAGTAQRISLKPGDRVSHPIFTP